MFCVWSGAINSTRFRLKGLWVLVFGFPFHVLELPWIRFTRIECVLDQHIYDEASAKIGQKIGLPVIQSYFLEVACLLNPLLKYIHSTLLNINLLNVIYVSSISKPQGTDVLNLNLTPHCHVLLPYISDSDMKINHQRIQTRCSHASHRRHCEYHHYCKVGFYVIPQCHMLH